MISVLLIAALAASSPQGLPTPEGNPIKTQAIKAQAINRGEWAYSTDLPVSLRNEPIVKVDFRLKIDTRGRVSECQVTRSSGFTDADEAVCGAVTRRARFRPARDAKGAAIPSEYSGFVTFTA